MLAEDKIAAAKSAALVFVDDEAYVLSALQRIFDNEGRRVIVAATGAEALEYVEKEEVAVILSDLRMPDMSGIDLLKKVQCISPDTIRMILTASIDVDSAIKAINDSKVYRFIVKPWNETELKTSVLQAFDYYVVNRENQRLSELIMKQNQTLKGWNRRLSKEVEKQTFSIAVKNQELGKLNRQLEGNFVDTIKTFSALLDMRDPETCSHSRRVTQAARFMGKQLEMTGENMRTLEIAAMLHDIGKIGIPDTILKKPPSLRSRTEKDILQRHPILGQNCVDSITRLCNAGILIRHHHEQFGGGGYPDRISGETIPLGSRIIAAADALDWHLNSRTASQKLPPRDVLKLMRSQAGSLFDPRVINAMIPFIVKRSRTAASSVERLLPISSLEEGMVLSRDIFTGGNILLIAHDEILTRVYIEKIRNYAHIDPSISSVYISMQTASDANGFEDEETLMEAAENVPIQSPGG